MVMHMGVFEERARVRDEEEQALKKRARKKPSKPICSEADIQRTCTEYLELDGWRALRTDPVSRKEWGKGFGEPGMADHLYIRYALTLTPNGTTRLFPGVSAQVLWIEWKSARGKARTHQTAWMESERARGGLVLLAGVDFPASIEGFQEWYRASGLRRRVQ